MSREIRRVPLDYKHPVGLNPHWEANAEWRLKYGRGKVSPALHKQDEQFIPLFEYSDLIKMNEETENDRQSYEKREGHPWDFSVKYHLTGFKGSQDDTVVVHPFYNEGDTWDDEGTKVRDEDHLQELLLQKSENEKREFSPDTYMPSFDEYSDDELGYCLYETVSEGTPVTPVFATPEELVEYLVSNGTEADPPLRREAAESIVSTGFTMGSMFAVGGKLYNSTEDADKIRIAKYF